jgi:RNA recognition motif-containing protein
MSAAVETAATTNEGAAATTETHTKNAAQDPEVIASAAEGSFPADEMDVAHTHGSTGRRLYIGNLAYATTEGELKTFFKEFLV